MIRGCLRAHELNELRTDVHEARTAALLYREKMRGQYRGHQNRLRRDKRGCQSNKSIDNLRTSAISFERGAGRDGYRVGAATGTVDS